MSNSGTYILNRKVVVFILIKLLVIFLIAALPILVMLMVLSKELTTRMLFFGLSCSSTTGLISLITFSGMLSGNSSGNYLNFRVVIRDVVSFTHLDLIKIGWIVSLAILLITAFLWLISQKSQKNQPKDLKTSFHDVGVQKSPSE
jgi:hypothetical protein